MSTAAPVSSLEPTSNLPAGTSMQEMNLITAINHTLRLEM
jgi:hypothetical protein